VSEVQAMRGRPALRYVILGNSVAGIAAAREIRRLDPAGQITIVSDERTPAYSRVMLPLYIAGKRSRRDVVLAPRAFYTAHRIRLLRGQAAERVDVGARTVAIAGGRHLPYDRLLVATGSSPHTLRVPGGDLSGVWPLRSMADADGIKAALRSSRGPVVVVGGGFVGMKSVEALAHTRREIHVVISSDRILSQMLDATASGLFLAALRLRGVGVHLRTDAVAFVGQDRLEAVRLSNGSDLACDLAIVGKGVRPNVDCLQGSGVALQQGVRVDDRMATSVPDVYAAGDVAEPVEALGRANMPSAIWPSASEGGRIAGSNMAGAPATFSGALRMNAVEILGVRAVSVGDRHGDDEVTYLRGEAGLYRKLVFADGRLRGYLLVGDIGGAGVLTALVKSGAEVSRDLLVRDLGRGVSYRPRLSALGDAVRAGAWGGMAT
jgi:NAD(P)H-nitrite reductase large subunit